MPDILFEDDTMRLDWYNTGDEERRIKDGDAYVLYGKSETDLEDPEFAARPDVKEKLDKLGFEYLGLGGMDRFSSFYFLLKKKDPGKYDRYPPEWLFWG